MLARYRRSLGCAAVLATLLCGLAGAACAQALDEQGARIRTVIESITTCVDLRRFDLLGRFYAEEVVADYSSLWGTPPRTLTRAEIGPAWAGFIPGFDTTKHDLSDLDVRIDGRRARASATLTATHWLDGETWVLHGSYVFELSRRADTWVVNGWTFLFERESGERSLVDLAEERAGRWRDENHL